MDRRTLLKAAARGAQLAGLSLAGAQPGAPAHYAGNGLADPPGRESGASGGSYPRIKAYLDSVPAMDLHEHLRDFDRLQTHLGLGTARGPNLAGLWKASYLSRIVTFTPWEPDTTFEQWWPKAQKDFVNFRTTGFYRYIGLALRDLYGLDFNHLTEAQAADLNRRIHQNYESDAWLRRVLLEKANIEGILCDRFWDIFNFRADYPFELLTLRVNQLVTGYHPSVFQSNSQHPDVPSESHVSATTERA